MGLESDILKKPIMSFQHNINVYVIWPEVRIDITLLKIQHAIYSLDPNCPHHEKV